MSSEIFYNVCNLFSESQHHSSSHRKNIQSLIKIYKKIKSSENLNEENIFLQSFCHCLHVLLSLKRGEHEVAGRILRFAVGFIVKNGNGNGDDCFERFVEGLMRHLLENVDSKDKLIRARICQLMVACLSSVQELSDNIWSIFRIKMTERLFDKEASVRVHAIHSMARLQVIF